MTPLKNPKHEAFVHHYLKCGDATEAFELTGYTRDSANAHRLLKRPKVQERLRELQDEIAAKVPLTIEGLIAECEEIRVAAKDKNQFAAAMKAVLGKAQLGGLLVERSKVEVTNTDPFRSVENLNDLYLAVADEWTEHSIALWADYRDEDREYIAQVVGESMREANAKVQARIEEIHLRPRLTVNMEDYKRVEPLKRLPSPPETDSQSPTG
jgi:Terminase small subunit